MKRLILISVFVLLTAGCLYGQEAYLWLRLSENRVITNAEFRSVDSDTLVVLRGGRIYAVPLDEIVLMRVMGSSSTLKGLAIGAGSGLAVGGLVGGSLNALGKPGPSIATSVAIFTVVGGIVGGTIAAFEKEGDIVDVSSKSAVEKEEVIRTLVSKVAAEGK